MEEIKEYSIYMSAFISVVSIFVEISPVKINPISCILGWIGEKIYGSVKESIAALDRKIDDNEIDCLRREILDFANSCRNKGKHTQDEFRNVISMNKKYHEILKRRSTCNGVVDEDFRYIQNVYNKCSEENSFL